MRVPGSVPRWSAGRPRCAPRPHRECHTAPHGHPPATWGKRHCTAGGRGHRTRQAHTAQQPMASAHPSVLTQRPGAKQQGSQNNPGPRGRLQGWGLWHMGTEQPSGQEEIEGEKKQLSPAAGLGGGSLCISRPSGERSATVLKYQPRRAAPGTGGPHGHYSPDAGYSRAGNL